mmetsp:Transcript_2116/g.7674  ORF Transcript_2116/g.7674 Transcript_2116/m.7674 type:complete len:227 (+) Transcript_2116:44-724(+)
MPRYNTLPGEVESDENSTTGVPVVKLLLVGDAKVGKSAVLCRFCDGVFEQPEYVPTLGMDFKVRFMRASGQALRLQVWDTAGQPQFKEVTTTYYRGAHGCMVVYSVADRTSFDNASSWIREFRVLAEEGTPVVVVGSKCDEEEGRAVSAEEGEALARLNGCGFVEVSARTGAGIEEAFGDLALKMLAVHRERSETQRSSMSSATMDFDSLLPRKKETFPGSCCTIQ